MRNSRIAIIGGGNLGSAIAEGLIKSKFISADHIVVTRRNVGSLKALRDLGVETISDNRQAISKSEVIIVALKPYNVKEVLEELKDVFDPSKHIVISVVTGIFLE